jgi:predicted RND superfamily exporter protein
MPIIEKFARSFFRVIISNPRIVLSGFLIAAGALGYQARHFEINASADTLLMKGDRHYIQTRVVNRRFSPQEEFLLIGYKPKNHPLFSEKTFKDLKELSEKLKKLDRVQSVRSILNVPILSNLEKRPTSSRFDGPASSESDIAEMTIEKQHFTVDEIKQVFGGHPLYEDLLINKDQTATALQVLFKRNKKIDQIQNRILDLQKKTLKGGLSRKDLEKIEQLKKKSAPIEKRYDQIRSSEIKEIRRIAAEYEQDAKIYLGGLHVLAYQLVRIIKHDLIIFGGAIAVMICLVLYWLFRKVRWVIIPVICCVCSVLSTLGLFGMLDLKATVISSSFISLQLILTLGITIHLIVQYREYCSEHPEWEQEELVTKTVLRKAGPCFYAGLTNMVGFASLTLAG